MFTKRQLSFKYTPLKNITLYEGIDRDMLSAMESVTFKLTENDGFTVKGLELFLQIHPIHAIKVSRKELYKCIAGLRSYQLAKTCFEDNHPIPLLIHRNSKKEDFENLASTEALLSSLVYGLDGLAWSNDLLNLFNSVDTKLRKEIILSIGNKKKLTELLGRSRQSIYTKATPPKSLLKQKQEEVKAIPQERNKEKQ